MLDLDRKKSEIEILQRDLHNAEIKFNPTEPSLNKRTVQNHPHSGLTSVESQITALELARQHAAKEAEFIQQVNLRYYYLFYMQISL